MIPKFHQVTMKSWPYQVSHLIWQDFRTVDTDACLSQPISWSMVAMSQLQCRCQKSNSSVPMSYGAPLNGSSGFQRSTIKFALRSLKGMKPFLPTLKSNTRQITITRKVSQEFGNDKYLVTFWYTLVVYSAWPISFLPCFFCFFFSSWLHLAKIQPALNQIHLMYCEAHQKDMISTHRSQ